MARASVIIPVWNGEAYLPACLDALLPQLRPGDEVIAVDNASPDGSAALIAGQYPRVRLLRQERNLGFTGGCNAGLRAAAGEYLLLLNQDVTVAEGWLEAMLAGLAADGVGIAGCKLWYPGEERRLQHAGGYLTPPAAWPGHYGLGEEDQGQHDEAREVEYVIGAALGAKRSVLDRIGLLDEGFFLYYEDVDLCLRCRRAGLRVVYLPAAAGVHVESAATVKGSPAYLERFNTGRWRLILKHYPVAMILGATLPAEREWLAQAGPAERAAAAVAYAGTLAALPEIITVRARDGGGHVEPLGIEALVAFVRGLRGLPASSEEPTGHFAPAAGEPASPAGSLGPAVEPGGLELGSCAPAAEPAERDFVPISPAAEPAGPDVAPAAEEPASPAGPFARATETTMPDPTPGAPAAELAGWDLPPRAPASPAGSLAPATEPVEPDFAPVAPAAKPAGADLAPLVTLLDAHTHLTPQPFRSRVPVLGPVIAWFRTLWNSVSTRWYLQPLLQQQTEFNVLVRETLDACAAQQGQLAALLAALETDTRERLTAAEARTGERLTAAEARTGGRLAAAEARAGEQLVAAEARTGERLAAAEARMNERLAAIDARLYGIEAALEGHSAWAQAHDRQKVWEDLRLEDHDAWLAQYDREQTQERHDLAETAARLIRLGRLVDEVEARLAAIEAAADAIASAIVEAS